MACPSCGHHIVMRDRYKSGIFYCPKCHNRFGIERERLYYCKKCRKRFSGSSEKHNCYIVGS